jgi:23S rRNA (pseudouridine1915-N3)-methyltransferase
VRLTVAAIGRERAGPERALFDHYRKRSPWPLRLVELAPQARLPLERRRADEALRLLRSVPDGAVMIALDERGAQLDTLAFARRLAGWREQGRSEIAFLIGGPDGLGAPVLERAALVLALGPMTWPHRLVRVMLAEQLYRAQTILAGHPYHRV